MCDSKIAPRCMGEQRHYLLNDGRKVCSECLPFINGHDKNKIMDLATGEYLSEPRVAPSYPTLNPGSQNEPGHGFPGGVK